MQLHLVISKLDIIIRASFCIILLSMVFCCIFSGNFQLICMYWEVLILCVWWIICSNSIIFLYFNLFKWVYNISISASPSFLPSCNFTPSVIHLYHDLYTTHAVILACSHLSCWAGYLLCHIYHLHTEGSLTDSTWHDQFAQHSWSVFLHATFHFF